MNLITYKGYIAQITFDTDDMLIVGEVIGIPDIVAFHAETCSQVKDMLRQSVDNYLDFCKKVGKEPDPPVGWSRDPTPGQRRIRCRFPQGITIKPDGVNQLDPCTYKVKEIHTNVTVTVSQCEKCGHVDISWERQEETEDIIYEKLGPQPEGD